MDDASFKLVEINFDVVLEYFDYCANAMSIDLSSESDIHISFECGNSIQFFNLPDVILCSVISSVTNFLSSNDIMSNLVFIEKSKVPNHHSIAHNLLGKNSACKYHRN